MLSSIKFRISVHPGKRSLGRFESYLYIEAQVNREIHSISNYAFLLAVLLCSSAI